MQKNSILKTKTLFTNARVYKAMADNKFYLILAEEEVEDKFFTKELAIKDTKNNIFHGMYKSLCCGL